MLTGEKNKVRLPSEEVAMATSDNLLLLRSIRDCLIIAVDWCKTPPLFSIALKGLFTLSESERERDFFLLILNMKIGFARIYKRIQKSCSHWAKANVKAIESYITIWWVLLAINFGCFAPSEWRWIKDRFRFYFRSLWMYPYIFSWIMKTIRVYRSPLPPFSFYPHVPLKSPFFIPFDNKLKEFL